MSSMEHVDIKSMSHPEKATLLGTNKFLGFWFFLGGETVLFGTLFATFISLRNKVGTGPSSQELFSMPLTFISTMFLLTSSLTSVFAILGMKDHKVNKMRLWFGLRYCLVLAF